MSKEMGSPPNNSDMKFNNTQQEFGLKPNR